MVLRLVKDSNNIVGVVAWFDSENTGTATQRIDITVRASYTPTDAPEPSAYATTSASGLVELATNAEASATSSPSPTRAVTPAGLNNRMDGRPH